jgi:hypothetical protein
MQRIIVATAASLLVASAPFGNAQASSPKLDRSRQLSEALKHLNQIARTLDEPIDKIEYGSKGEILFSGGKCSVPVIIHAKLLTQKEIENDAPADYWSEVGPTQCTP